ncbi:MAG: acyl carrier protein [Lachnospiraceae bacterium]|nr:acyl carrier protein [Lachnospiraceae bacterium]MCI8825609.1 acyl carrier protein [Lachnospiraceae bacterium]MCI9369808.1 acyl carrier protein [Lachnospiraceae bacterium]
MERQEVVNKIKEILLLLVDIEDEVELGEDDILNDGEWGIDSLIMVQIIVEIERAFDIKIEDEYLSMDFLSTIGSIADFVMEEKSKDA